MCITEYDEERTLAETREEGAIEMLIGLVKDGILTLSEAAKRINMPLSEFQAKAGMTA